MLMPIGDEANHERTHAPIVTYILIAINLLVFFGLQSSDAFTYGFSVVPREITSGRDLVGGIATQHGMIPQAPGPSPIWMTIFTAMFMHGGFMHLFGNMLYLWIFGDNIEDAMGHFKFLIFYLVCGVAATAAHILTEPGSLVPSLGASGAIAGVLGGYLLMYPTRQVRVLIGFFGIIHLPALIVIGIWGVLQFMSGVASIAPGTEQGKGGVAYWAHIGGFIAGLILISFFRNPEVKRRVEYRMHDYRY
jgi:membrane associated rhomboid family serine protease